MTSVREEKEKMADLIDRQAAIRETWREPTYFDPLNVMTEMRDRLKALPSAEPEPQWIPCSERLPEKYGWYQVTLKDGRVSRLYYDYKSGRWVDNVRKHMFELYDIYSKRTHKRITEEKEDVYWDDWVIAWMPLPEPWKGGGEDE